MPALFPEWFPALVFLRHLADILNESLDIVMGLVFMVGTLLTAAMWGTRRAVVVGYLLLVLWIWVQPSNNPQCELVAKNGQLLCEKTK